MKTLVLFLLLLTTNLMAFDGGVSVIRKHDMYGAAFKAEVLRVEYLEGTRNQTFMDSTKAVSEVKKELNIALEPDLTVAKHKNIKLEVSPLLGVSSKTTDELNQNKVGPACSIDNGHIPEGSCFSYRKTNDVSFMNGASVKLDVEPDPRLYFYVKTGLISNGDGYKSQSSIGFTIPW